VFLVKYTRMDNKPSIFRGNDTEWAGSRETTSSLRSRRSFFLDISFIELIEDTACAAERPATGLLGLAPPKSPQAARGENEGEHGRQSERVKRPDE
jgi:hypothetical protein